MQAGRRDQRVRYFSFVNANSDGWATSGYAYEGEYWANVATPSMAEVTVGGQAEHVVDAVFTFLRNVPIQPGGLLKTRNDGKYYKITGTPPLTRRSNDRQAFATYVDDISSFNITGEPA
jgi:hypothetical protein